MSGGSMDYLCFKVDDVASELATSKCPTRRAFAEHLKKVAHALHEIEWVDSADKASPDDIVAMRAALDNYAAREMEQIIADGRKVIDQLHALGV